MKGIVWTYITIIQFHHALCAQFVH